MNNLKEDTEKIKQRYYADDEDDYEDIEDQLQTLRLFPINNAG